MVKFIRRIAIVLACISLTSASLHTVAGDKNRRLRPTLTHKESQATTAKPVDKRNLDERLEQIRYKYDLPALAGGILKGEKLIALRVIGVRRAGRTEPVTPDDQFHIGSCAKAMTATLCAIIIEDEKLKPIPKLKWDSTIGEVFKDQLGTIPADYRNVTLEQLLTHRSGLPEDFNPEKELWDKIWGLSGPMLEQRRRLVELWLSQTRIPGSEFHYANGGYDIAGAMCERVTGKTYEVLLREKLLNPLGMASAGFGAAGSIKPVDQPWGHTLEHLQWIPRPPGKDADNPACTAPSGTLHCSMADWAKFAALHLRGEKGTATTQLLPREVFERLHKPTGDYAFGWYVYQRDWAGGPALYHDGTNTYSYAIIWIAPNIDMAFFAATNVDTCLGYQACDDVISALIDVANLNVNHSRTGANHPPSAQHDAHTRAESFSESACVTRPH